MSRHPQKPTNLRIFGRSLSGIVKVYAAPLASNSNLTESEVKAEELELASFSDVYATFQATSRSHEALFLGTEPLAARAIGWPCLAIARATLWTGSTRGAGFEGSLASLTERIRPGV